MGVNRTGPQDPVMEIKPAILRYRDWEVRVALVREKNQGADSEEEDALFEESDSIWWSLSPEEYSYLDKTRSPNYEALAKWLPESP